MQVETLMDRLSECVDDLGLLLDQIHRFPQKQRQGYFDRIQTLKDRLLSLKSSLRDQNSSQVEKQYKQLYLAMNALKTEISQHQPPPPSRDSRPKDMREGEKEALWADHDLLEREVSQLRVEVQRANTEELGLTI
ncbi:unnamed protein product [Sphagnum balticum]